MEVAHIDEGAEQEEEEEPVDRVPFEADGERVVVAFFRAPVIVLARNALARVCLVAVFFFCDAFTPG